MKINLVEREFVYHGTTLPCPNPKFSIEEVRSFYAAQFPELTNAAITGPETVGDRLRYTFERHRIEGVMGCRTQANNRC